LCYTQHALQALYRKYASYSKYAAGEHVAELHNRTCKTEHANLMLFEVSQRHAHKCSICDGSIVQEHHVKFEKYKMQDALIQEEEEGQRMDKNKAAAKAASEREKKQRKKVSHAVMITAAS